MTNEELDKARAQEARRIFDEAPSGVPGHVATIAARLAREGWTPPPPVDPDVLAVRGLLASRAYSSHDPQDYLAGRYDDYAHFLHALAAYKFGRAAR